MWYIILCHAPHHANMALIHSKAKWSWNRGNSIKARKIRYTRCCELKHQLPDAIKDSSRKWQLDTAEAYDRCGLREQYIFLKHPPIHFLLLSFLVFLHPEETTPTKRSFNQFSSCGYADWQSKSSKLHGNTLCLATMPDNWQASYI